ncbi:hypothetical protein [Glaciihabitans sp. dw_435]|uniref:hypothetical protein n=1 Tax=Glaciihabitans sp. dw_435 TaxID=2720081 RepID=UPI001BD272E6|nr:hypothetical protein [Glaciihabitans sp. dw_435]
MKDLYADDFPHGTANGYDQGCKGAAQCLYHGSTTYLTCVEASMLRRGDYNAAKLPSSHRFERPTVAPVPKLAKSRVEKPTPIPADPKPAAVLKEVAVASAPVTAPKPTPPAPEPAPTAEPAIAEFNHETATDAQLRSHYASGCRRPECREATSRAARERNQAKKLREAEQLAIAEAAAVVETTIATEAVEPTPVADSDEEAPRAFTAEQFDVASAHPLDAVMATALSNVAAPMLSQDLWDSAINEPWPDIDLEPHLYAEARTVKNLVAGVTPDELTELREELAHWRMRSGELKAENKRLRQQNANDVEDLTTPAHVIDLPGARMTITIVVGG